MDTENRDLWDRLDNESERAHRAFQTFLSLPSEDRTVVEAYRSHVGNPDAVKPSDTWTRWSRDFAWVERASAYDNHLASVRRVAYEKAIEEEAARQAREIEKVRGRSNELMTLGYEEAMRWFEEVGASGMRASDVIQITRLHMDYLKAFGVEPEQRNEDDWTEEDDAAISDILKEIDELEDFEDSGAEGPEEGEGT